MALRSFVMNMCSCIGGLIFLAQVLIAPYNAGLIQLYGVLEWVILALNGHSNDRRGSVYDLVSLSS